MSLKDQELSIPEEVLAAPADQVSELIRAWWCRDQPAMMIRPAAEDPALIGYILSDLMWHFSNAYEAKGGWTQKDAWEALMRGWNQGQAVLAQRQAEGTQS